MSSSPPIQVMIVDDHPMVRDGLKVFLLAAKDMELAAEAGSGEEALRLGEQVQPDVILMDLKMPGLDGVSCTRAIRDSCPQAQVIALTSFAEQGLVQQALQAGAIGYLLKDVSAAELAEAIRAAFVGDPSLSPIAARTLIKSATQPSQIGADLTRRERQVLALLAAGLSNLEIAQRLTISLSTTGFHVSNVLTKLGAANRTEAASLALLHKLTP